MKDPFEILFDQDGIGSPKTSHQGLDSLRDQQGMPIPRHPVIPPEANGVWMVCFLGSSHTSKNQVFGSLGYELVTLIPLPKKKKKNNLAFRCVALSEDYTPESLTASLPLNNHAWKTILSFWEDNFSGPSC